MGVAPRSGCFRNPLNPSSVEDFGHRIAPECSTCDMYGMPGIALAVHVSLGWVVSGEA